VPNSVRKIAPVGAGAATRHRDELIPLYDNANPSDGQTGCSQSNGAGAGSYLIAGRSRAALVYDAPDASACTSLATQRLGYVYAGTWYDTLPPFWNSFLSAC